MKKIVSLVLVFVLCLSLCACGKSDGCSCNCAQCAQCEKKTHTHEEVLSATMAEIEDGKRKIVFPEPLFLAEDQKIRVELIRFFEEDSPYKHIGKYVTMKFTNKADYEIGVRLENLFVDGNAADYIYSGSAPNILPGETATYHFEIMDTFKNTLDSLDQLYTLKGRFKVMRRTGTNHYADAYEVPFSVEEAPNGATSPVEAKKEYVPGDTVSTDMAEFTLNEFVFRKGLATYSEQGKKVNIDDLYLPENGMVFATSKFTLCNLSGESYNVHSSIQFYVDYNDGYRYSTRDRHSSYLSHSKGIWKMTGNGAGSGYFAELSPLMRSSYDIYIPVPQMIETDTSTSLCIIVELPTSNGGKQEFAFRIR